MSIMKFHDGVMYDQSNDVFQSYFKFKLEYERKNHQLQKRKNWTYCMWWHQGRRKQQRTDCIPNIEFLRIKYTTSVMKSLKLETLEYHTDTAECSVCIYKLLGGYSFSSVSIQRLQGGFNFSYVGYIMNLTLYTQRKSA